MMDFTLSDDRRMLSESLRRWLAAEYGVETRNAVAYDAPWHDPAKWAGLAELGPFYAFAPEEAGGFGGTGFDVTCVFEELGRALCPEPVLAQLLAIRALLTAGEDVAPLLAGETRAALAWLEPEADGLDTIAARAAPADDGWTLTGRKSLVYGGQDADRLLVAARDPQGTLALFDVAAADAEVVSYGMIDGGGAAEVMLDRTPARMVLADARTALDSALDWGALALCAEAVGAMDAAHGMLVDYLKTRTQFGRPIASFQALQHRAVELMIEIEQARSITIRAASRMDAPDRSVAVSMAKSLVGRIARLVAEETIQMQGGIAMTWEYPASHYAKRLVMIDHQLGDADTHLERVMESLR